MVKRDFALVSFIGRNDKEYDTVDYILPDDNEIVRSNDTSVALLMAGNQHWNIKKAVIVGTYTSNWFELVSRADNEDLYIKLKEVCKAESEENYVKLAALFKDLAAYFNSKYHVILEPIAHRTDLSDDTIYEIASVYDNEVFKSIKGYPNILIDITHGFRHMPLLLFQMIEQHMHQLEDVSVEVIYGEIEKYINDDGLEQKRSIFRELKKYWDVSKLTDAINHFSSSLDGTALVPYLQRENLKEIADWIESFTMIIKSDYLMQVYQLVKVLPTVLLHFDDADLDESSWLGQIKDSLCNIKSRFDGKAEPYDIYIEFARLLDDKNLVTQSTIALASAIETRACVHFARLEGMNDYYYVGDYKAWAGNKEEGSNKEGLRTAFKNILPYKLKADWLSFYQNRRNKIAHAAGSSWNSYPAKESFQMKDYFKMAEALFEFLDSRE